MPADAMISVIGNTLTFRGKTYRCAIGKGGFSSNKKEGDGCTPIGTFALRECWYRADRVDVPKTGLPLKIIQENDGWCDDVMSAEYNHHFKISSPSPLVGEGGERGVSPQSHALMVSPLPNPLPQGERELLKNYPPQAQGISFEKLWRDDPVYDLVIPLGYNDDPVISGKGSAIFMHVAKPNYEPTEGCVALALLDLQEVLAACGSGTVIEIRDK